MEPEEVSKTRSSKKPKIIITPELVNREIVALRAPIKQAQRFLLQKLLRKKKYLSQCNEKKENPKNTRKLEKIEEDLKELKDLKIDDVAKLALVNDEPRNKLLTNVKNANERVMYSLIFEKPIVKCIEKYHATYSDWRSATPYFLQRLGVRNKNFKDKISKAKLTEANVIPLGKRSDPDEETSDDSADDEDENSESEEGSENDENIGDEEGSEEEVDSKDAVDDDDEAESDAADDDDADDADDDDADDDDDEASNEDEEDEELSDVEMGTDSEDDSEKTVERRNLLLGLAGLKENKERPKIAPKKKEIVETDEEDDEDDEQENSPSKSSDAPSKLISKKKQEDSKQAIEKKSTKIKAKVDVSKKPKAEVDASKKQNAKVDASKKKKATAAPVSDIEAAPKVSKKKKKVGSLQSMLNVSQLRSSEEGVIQRIQLSRGGEVSFKKTNQHSKKDEEKKEEEPSTNYDPFFQSCDTDSNEEGEQSADDDQDLPILNYPKGEKGSVRQNVGRNKAFDREGGRGFDRVGGRGSGRVGGRGFGRMSGRDSDRAGGKSFDRGGGRGSDRGGGRGSDRGGGRGSDRGGGRGSDRGGGRGSGRGGGRGFENRAERPFAAKTQIPAKGPAGLPEELHPSWAAKRLKKEQLAAKPQGTRTVFGED